MLRKVNNGIRGGIFFCLCPLCFSVLCVVGGCVGKWYIWVGGMGRWYGCDLRCVHVHVGRWVGVIGFECMCIRRWV